MTKNKDKKDKKAEEIPTANTIDATTKKELSVKADNKSTNSEHDIIKERMEAEPDLLEEKEVPKQKLLEFYSKVELIKQLKEDEELIEEKDTIIKDLDGWKQKYIHLQAEFENANKRWDKSRKNLKIQYTASVLKSFLPLYDSFKKAIDSSSQESEVLTQFYNQFLSILKFQGAEPIKIKEDDLFDYSIHEALTSLEREDIPENTILNVVQDGWKLSKDILRYSKVVISKKPEPEPEPEPEPKPEQEKEMKEDAKREDKELKSKEEDKEEVIETKDNDEEPKSNEMIDNNSENQENSNPNEKSNK